MKDPALHSAPFNNSTEDISKYHTYEEWIGSGRGVKAGEHARFYSVDPDDAMHAYAVFHENQTEPLKGLEDRTGWRLVPADEQKAAKRKAPVKASYSNGTLYLWVGNNKDLIAHLKKAKARFNPKTSRWQLKAADPWVSLEGIRRDYRVELGSGLDGSPATAPTTAVLPPESPESTKIAPAPAAHGPAAGVCKRCGGPVAPQTIGAMTVVPLYCSRDCEHAKPAPVTRGPFGKPMPEQPKTPSLGGRRKAA